MKYLASALIVTLVTSLALAADYPPAATQPIFPPALPWSGKTRELALKPDDKWATPCEASGFRLSPDYNDTIAWLKKLVDAAPQQLKMVSLGKSPEGREIWMVIASREGNFDPQSLKNANKPIFLAQAGIHSGEIDGKDAGMMLLRNLTVTGKQSALLDRANFLFVPIFSVDAHERRSRFTRSNQNGPEIAGWRTTSRNLNLNRDYAKIDTAEMRAMVKALNDWEPDLYYDLHVTDGSDYNYDITWGANGPHAHSPNIANFLQQTLTPMLAKSLSDAGHFPGRLVFEVDNMNPEKGLQEMTAEARYSHGYGDARHIPSILVENHALRTYDQRVLGTYVLLESTMRAIGEKSKDLKDAIAKDRAARPETIPLAFDESPNPEMIEYASVEFRHTPSPISGGVRVEWLGKPKTLRVPYIRTNKVVASAKRPKAYIVPPGWPEVIDRLKAHGIQMETLDAARAVDVTMYRINDAKLMTEPFEGHIGLSELKAAPEQRKETFASGSVRISTDQPLGNLAIVLLEPMSPDSFLRWGFYSEILQRTEYIDAYIIEPMAERMMKDDSKLAAEFLKKLAEDKEFASSPAKRLEWFYQKTPFIDERWRLYPVAREE
ncbi:MAG: M14 family metallopeptidase [Anaerolineae bacterium]|nr:M14 family metallopeptidase [Phycisphaerae bacterium]